MYVSRVECAMFIESRRKWAAHTLLNRDSLFTHYNSTLSTFSTSLSSVPEVSCREIGELVFLTLQGNMWNTGAREILEKFRYGYLNR